MANPRTERAMIKDLFANLKKVGKLFLTKLVQNIDGSITDFINFICGAVAFSGNHQCAPFGEGDVGNVLSQNVATHLH